MKAVWQFPDANSLHDIAVPRHTDCVLGGTRGTLSSSPKSRCRYGGCHAIFARFPELLPPRQARQLVFVPGRNQQTGDTPSVAGNSPQPPYLGSQTAGRMRQGTFPGLDRRPSLVHNQESANIAKLPPDVSPTTAEGAPRSSLVVQQDDFFSSRLAAVLRSLSTCCSPSESGLTTRARSPTSIRQRNLEKSRIDQNTINHPNHQLAKSTKPASVKVVLSTISGRAGLRHVR